MKPATIKFIYFDVGGVAILDFSKTNKWDQMLRELDLDETQKEDYHKVFKEYSQEIYTGKIDLDKFIEILKKELNLNFPNEYSMLDDFVNRFEANPGIESIIAGLKEKYRVGLLTTMYVGMLDKIKERGILPNIDWDVVVDSSIVGFAKPQDEVFEIAEERAGVAPENIVFIENGIKHVEAAKERGWQTFLYDPADTEKSNRELLNLLEF